MLSPSESRWACTARCIRLENDGTDRQTDGRTGITLTARRDQRYDQWLTLFMIFYVFRVAVWCRIMCCSWAWKLVKFVFAVIYFMGYFREIGVAKFGLKPDRVGKFRDCRLMHRFPTCGFRTPGVGGRESTSQPRKYVKMPCYKQATFLLTFTIIPGSGLIHAWYIHTYIHTYNKICKAL